MNWKIGDVAIICNVTVHTEYNGMEVTILSELRMSVYGDLVYDTDAPPKNGADITVVQPKYLRPLPPPNEVTTWDTCEFQPKELIGVES